MPASGGAGFNTGSGGGGGYYGGGGGLGGGGGGSGYVAPACAPDVFPCLSDASTSTGGNTGNGVVTFTWDTVPAVAAGQSSVSVPENAGTNTGTFSSLGGAVALTASTGTITQDNTDGTWTWSGTGDESSPQTVIVTATNGSSSATASFTVSFTDAPPTVAADQPSVSAPENTAATNTGTFSDYDDAVTISASSGTITQDTGTNGTWSWSGTVAATAYTVTITATNADSGTDTASFTVSPPAQSAPSITSPAATAFTVGTPGTFTVTATGIPTPSLSAMGLPAGVTFTNHGDGTATLAYNGSKATPGGLVSLSIGASNGVNPPAAQDFALSMVTRPVVTSVTPNAGPANGGQSITITGRNFVPGAQVVIGQGHGPGSGAIAATNVTVVSSTEITAITGGGAKVGNWSLYVITAGGTTSGIAYQYGPKITSVTPNAGPVGGGQSITITGTNFAPGATVVIGQGHGAGAGAIAATNINVVSPTEITAVTGGGARAGHWNLYVISGGGTSAVTAGSRYQYQ